jgi:hypothetical protein
MNAARREVRSRIRLERANDERIAAEALLMAERFEAEQNEALAEPGALTEDGRYFLPSELTDGPK